MFTVHGFWMLCHGDIYKHVGKGKKLKKWLLHCFASNMHKNEKFAANAVN